MKVLIGLVILVGMAQSFKKYGSSKLQKLYREKKAEFHMDGFRSARDEKDHFKEFCNFANMVKQHNEEDGAEWQGEINKFALMTEAEKENYRGLNASGILEDIKIENLGERSVVDGELDLVERAETVDYTNKLPPVKNQKYCGSCWTFGGTAALEYQVNKNSKSIKALSEQQYLDCVYEGLRNGCNGGWPWECYTWTRENNNMIASQKDYPYVARDTKCKMNVKSAISGFKVRGTRKILKGDSYVYAAVKNPAIGVLSAAMGTDQRLESYSSGVFCNKWTCERPDHAVVIVGYGSLNGRLYFRVRNSWGADWGDKGYINLKRGPNVDTCSITSMAHYPIVRGPGEDDKDDKKKVCQWMKQIRIKLKGRLTEIEYTLDEAKKKCEEEEECKGISCNSDEMCMLNSRHCGNSKNSFTAYLCIV